MESDKEQIIGRLVIAGLSPRQAEALWYWRWRYFSVPQISDKMGIARSTAYNLIREANRRLYED